MDQTLISQIRRKSCICDDCGISSQIKTLFKGMIRPRLKKTEIRSISNNLSETKQRRSAGKSYYHKYITQNQNIFRSHFISKPINKSKTQGPQKSDPYLIVNKKSPKTFTKTNIVQKKISSNISEQQLIVSPLLNHLKRKSNHIDKILNSSRQKYQRSIDQGQLSSFSLTNYKPKSFLNKTSNQVYKKLVKKIYFQSQSSFFRKDVISEQQRKLIRI